MIDKKFIIITLLTFVAFIISSCTYNSLRQIEKDDEIKTQSRLYEQKVVAVLTDSTRIEYPKGVLIKNDTLT